MLQSRLNKQIAFALGIDDRSVKRHRSNFIRKLEVSSVDEPVQSTIEAGLFNKAGSSHF